jgi:AcrR family transcriptional regulator
VRQNGGVTSAYYSGSGDPARGIELLWGLRETPRRGPKPKLTVAAIVRTAIDIADAEGLTGLSMRRVAEDLGVAVMSLYTYVPGKAELIDLMLDTAYGGLAQPEEVPGGWRARLEHVARENWALGRRHPWTLQVAVSRPVLGPHETAKYDYELRAVDGIGLTDVEMDSVLTLVLGYVRGAVRGAVDAAEAERRTGMTDEQWWRTNAPLLAKVLDPGRYPLAARVGSAVGAEQGAAYDSERSFEFGLRRVLDGIQALVDTRQPS